MQTLKVIENYFITPVSQIAVWGKLGQCLTNLKTNFRALSMTVIICPLTPVFQECVLSLSPPAFSFPSQVSESLCRPLPTPLLPGG